jgi:hypothetical protein
MRLSLHPDVGSDDIPSLTRSSNECYCRVLKLPGAVLETAPYYGCSSVDRRLEPGLVDSVLSTPHQVQKAKERRFWQDLNLQPPDVNR